MKQYEIIGMSCEELNTLEGEAWESMAMARVEAQDNVLLSEGYGYNDDLLIYFGGDARPMITTYYDAIQILALKEGCDLVRFDNGNLGYIGYYGNYPISKNYFEIIRHASNEDIEEYN